MAEMVSIVIADASQMTVAAVLGALTLGLAISHVVSTIDR